MERTSTFVGPPIRSIRVLAGCDSRFLKDLADWAVRKGARQLVLPSPFQTDRRTVEQDGSVDVEVWKAVNQAQILWR